MLGGDAGESVSEQCACMVVCLIVLVVAINERSHSFYALTSVQQTCMATDVSVLLLFGVSSPCTPQPRVCVFIG